jgi:hypothetical protein
MGYFPMTSERGKRERWIVKVSAERLLACCEERIAYHNGRVAFWESQHADAEDKLRSGGIQLRHFDVSGGKRTEAQLDAGLAKRVGECEARMKENRQAVNRFVAFRALFLLTKGQEHELSVDDVLYFNIESADAGSDDAEE